MSLVIYLIEALSFDVGLTIFRSNRAKSVKWVIEFEASFVTNCFSTFFINFSILQSNQLLMFFKTSNSYPNTTHEKRHKLGKHRRKLKLKVLKTF